LTSLGIDFIPNRTHLSKSRPIHCGVLRPPQRLRQTLNIKC